jgi:hypothetical protein
MDDNNVMLLHSIEGDILSSIFRLTSVILSDKITLALRDTFGPLGNMRILLVLLSIQIIIVVFL